MATPLKLRDANGNIQEMTTSEENYIAYQVGLHLSSADSAEVGSLNRLTTGNTVGTFSNTFFNQPVGTHPSTSITTGTTNTTIYQTTGTAAETDSDVYSPLMWVDSASQTGFKLMPDTDLNEAIDRYLTTIHTNEYPGSYRLATSAPSSDWTSQQVAFTDTRSDGTSTNYYLWKRTDGTAPSTVRPMYVEDSAGGSGIALQEMDDRKIKYSFGQRAKTRLLSSAIGTYELRSATQGAPSSPGTWVSRGTATDTKQTTSQQLFTRDSTVNFQANYTKNYTKTYTTNFTRLFATIYTSVSQSSSYTRPYTRAFTRQDSEVFTRPYTNNFVATYTGEYDRPYTANYVNNFVANYISNYTKPYTRQFNSPIAYVGEYSNNYLGSYQTNYVATYDKEFIANYTEPYVGTYDTSYAEDYTSTYQSTYSTNYVSTTGIDYVGNYDAPYTPNYLTEYANVYTPNYISNYATLYTGEYEKGFIGPTYLRDYTSPAPRSDTFTVSFTTNYQRLYTSAYTGAFNAPYLATYTRNFLRQYLGEYEALFTNSFTNTYITAYDGALYSSEYAINYTGPYNRPFTLDYVRIYDRFYTRNFNAGPYTGPAFTTSTAPQQYVTTVYYSTYFMGVDLRSGGSADGGGVNIYKEENPILAYVGDRANTTSDYIGGTALDYYTGPTSVYASALQAYTGAGFLGVLFYQGSSRTITYVANFESGVYTAGELYSGPIRGFYIGYVGDVYNSAVPSQAGIYQKQTNVIYAGPENLSEPLAVYADGAQDGGSGSIVMNYISTGNDLTYTSTGFFASATYTSGPFAQPGGASYTGNYIASIYLGTNYYSSISQTAYVSTGYELAATYQSLNLTRIFVGPAFTPTYAGYTTGNELPAFGIKQYTGGAALVSYVGAEYFVANAYVALQQVSYGTIPYTRTVQAYSITGYDGPGRPYGGYLSDDPIAYSAYTGETRYGGYTVEEGNYLIKTFLKYESDSIFSYIASTASYTSEVFTREFDGYGTATYTGYMVYANTFAGYEGDVAYGRNLSYTTSAVRSLSQLVFLSTDYMPNYTSSTGTITKLYTPGIFYVNFDVELYKGPIAMNYAIGGYNDYALSYETAIIVPGVGYEGPTYAGGYQRELLPNEKIYNAGATGSPGTTNDVGLGYLGAFPTFYVNTAVSYVDQKLYVRDFAGYIGEYQFPGVTYYAGTGNYERVYGDTHRYDRTTYYYTGGFGTAYISSVPGIDRTTTTPYAESYEHALVFTGVGSVNSYTPNYLPNYEIGYLTFYQARYQIAIYSGTYSHAYAANYLTQYEATFNAPYTSNYIRNYASYYVKNYTSGYTNNFDDVNYTNTYSRIFSSTFQGDYATAYALEYTIDYTPNYQRNYTPNYISNYTSTTTISYQKEFSSGAFQADYAKEYTAPALGSYAGNYIRNYQGNYLNNYSGPTYDGALYESVYDRNFENTFIATYQKNYTISYDSTATVPGGGYIVFYDGQNYTRNYIIDYIGTYTNVFNAQYQNEFTQAYERQFLSPTYQGTYVDEFVFPYTVLYVTQYTGLYSSIYSGNYIAQYTGTYTGEYATEYTANYEAIYTREFAAQYIQDYLGNYEGNFEGETIDATSETNETYTLYVRIA